MCRTRAIDSTISLPPRVTASAATTLLVVLLVSTEGARRRELAELVTHHGLGHEDRDVLAAVVHGDRVTQHGGHDHRATRPRLDDVLRTRLVLSLNLAEQVLVDEGPLLETARHLLLPLLALLADGATTDDELVAFLVGATGTALGLTPRADRVATTGGLALTTTVRVVDGVHRDTADGRADALPTLAAGLAPVDVRLLGVADLADRGAAAQIDVADLARGQSQLGVGAVLGDEAHGGAGRAGELGSSTGLELDRVHDGTDRDVLQRQVVAHLDVGACAVLDDVALLELLGREDVALRAVDVVQERDARGAVGVVLDVRDLGVDAVLVVATEVDDAVLALVPSTDVAGRNATGVVASAGLRKRLDERLLGRRARDLREVGDRRAATTRGRRLVLANGHVSLPWSLADSREDVDRAGLERDDGALGVLALADAEPGAAGLADAVDRVHRGDLDAEDLLDGQLDLGLVGARVDDEGVLALIDEPVALLAHDRRDDDVAGVLAVAAHLAASSSEAVVESAEALLDTMASNAALVKTMSSETTTSYALSWSA